MSQSEIWQMSATHVAASIASGDISAREAVAANVDRMSAVNPALNAVVHDLSEQAMADAKQLDDQFARSGPVGPLHGVPVTIKENIDQTGLPTPNGVAAFKDVIAPADSPFVTNLKNAGAVIIGRTNTPEFSFRGTTDNPLHGRTFNPWNDSASAGGSSGGAGSAVMAGIGAIAHGNDIGGSLRFPSTCNGAVTVKPGLGRTPAYNPSQQAERGLLAQLMSVQGVICREARDVALAMQSAIAYQPTDVWQVPMPWSGPKPDGPMTIGFSFETYGFPMDSTVEAALHQAKDALEDAGYILEEVTTPDMFEIGKEATSALFGETKALVLPAMREYGSAEFNAYFDHCFEIAPPFEGDDLLAAMARRTGYLRDWLVLLDQYPLVLTPFLLAQTYAHGRDYEGREGVEEIMLKAFYSFALNYLGLPAGNVPAHFNGGLPVGVQVIGQRFREDLILEACIAIEDRVGIMAHRLFERL